MPCLPGLTPVNMLVQAGGDSAGTVDCKMREEPSAMSLRKFGRRPAEMRGARIFHVAPSIPRRISLFNSGFIESVLSDERVH